MIEDLFPVYKVKQLDSKGNVVNIYVFSQSELENSDVFSSEEANAISQCKIKVNYIKTNIHPDDNISNVKLKIAAAMKSSVSDLEMWLFCLNKAEFDVNIAINKMTMNNKLTLTWALVSQFMKNIYTIDGCIVSPYNPGLGESDDNIYEKIIEIYNNLQKKDYYYAVPAGDDGSNLKVDYSNPFYYTPQKEDIAAVDYAVRLRNTNLLFQTGNFHDNVIYMCLAQDMVKNTSMVLQLYYPFLYAHNITSIGLLEENRGELTREVDNKLGLHEDSFEDVNLFYDVYKKKTVSDKFKNISRTIRYFKFLVVSPVFVHIPNDVIFKVLHATQTQPFIKYNLGGTNQNIYRLYTDKINSDGQKLPYLNKTQVHRLIKDTAKTVSVAIYRQVQHQSVTYGIICEFFENGDIAIYSDPHHNFNVLWSDDINDKCSNFDLINYIIGLALNPIVEQLQPVFEQGGVKMKEYPGTCDPSVKILDIQLDLQYTVHTHLQFKSLMGCISTIFTQETGNRRGVIDSPLFDMRFKRVSNYSQSDSLEIFVVQKIMNNFSFNQIVGELMDNYKFSDEKAREYLQEKAQELNINENLLRKSKVGRKGLTVNFNPGFSTVFEINRATKMLTIRVQGINHLTYLNTISMYIDSLIRLSQDTASTGVDEAYIAELCKQREKKEISAEIQKKVESVAEEYITEDEDDEDEDVGFLNDELINLVGYVDDEDEESIFMEEDGEEEEESLAGPGEPDTDDDDDDVSVDSISVGEEEEEESLEGPGEPDEAEDDVSVDSISVDSISVGEDDEESSAGPGEPGTDEDDDVSVDSISVDSISVEDEEELRGGDNELHNIDGMRLKYPNPFASRIKDRIPEIFEKDDAKNVDAYSRMVPTIRTPIILDEKEKEEYTEKNQNINPQDILQYGHKPADPSDKYYFVCPKFWCLLTNKIVSEKDIMEGKCGAKPATLEDAIIPEKANKVPPGKYVFRFYSETDDDAKNAKKYPGFHKTKTAESKLCYPECLIKYDTAKVRAHIASCQAIERGAAPVVKKNADKCIIPTNILSSTKFPLNENTWAPPPEIFESMIAQIMKVPRKQINADKKMLMHGVENNAHQSFIACIADVMFYCQSNPSTKAPLIRQYIDNPRHNVPTIKEMKRIIIDNITLDTYVEYQNGNLVAIFLDPELEIKNNYSRTRLYKKMHKKDGNLLFLEDAIRSYENFIMFLNNDTVPIDHTYLWDLICTPNPKLFNNGLNLLIFQIQTNGIELVCPTNHYTNRLYNSKRDTLILLKMGNYYEPLYTKLLPEKASRGERIIKTYNLQQQEISPEINAIISRVLQASLIQKKCGVFPSIPQKYPFVIPPSLEAIIAQLDDKQYPLEKYIVNPINEIVGVIATINGKSGFIPCYATVLSTTIDANSINRSSNVIWKSYKETVSFLKAWSPAALLYKIVEQNKIIGVLTNANQFIPIHPAVPKEEHENDGMDEIENYNYLIADMKTLTTASTDSERIQFIHRKRVESKFYAIFRNTVRTLLSNYDNLEQRKQIQIESGKQYVLYIAQVEKVDQLLRQLVRTKGEHIIFAEQSKDLYDDENLEKIQMCYAPCNKKAVCALINDTCTLVLPKYNLVTNTDNEKMYYAKLSDELIRYKNIRTFMFTPGTYLSFDSVNYHVNNDEIIVMQDLLTDSSFESFWESEKNISLAKNQYARYTTYDTAVPYQSRLYDNSVKISNLAEV